MTQGVEVMEIFDDMESLEGPNISYVLKGVTVASVFRERMLLVVISTDPVRERSYAIELGGRWGNIAWIT